jgi:REP element-mobilizing transposase RayT
MNRGRRRETIFTGNWDYNAFLALLQESSELWGARIAAYCLMTNHYHLLVQTPHANLSRAMRHIDGIYTQRFNRRYKTVGQVFAGRYKSILVDADTYLLDLVRYIHKNPVRAGMVSDPRQYPWSSHHGYLTDALKWDWLFKGFVLSTFSSNSGEARRKYKRFIAGDDTAEIVRFFGGKTVHTVLGSDRFTRWVRERFSDRATKNEISGLRLFLPGIDEIVDAVCVEYGVGRDELLISKRGVTNEARNVAIYLSRRLAGENLSAIAERFNLTGYSTISNTVERMKRREGSDGELRKRIERIAIGLKKWQQKI